jgi:PAS domain-containing protein
MVQNDDTLPARQALQAAIDSLDDGLVLYDRDDRLVACNRSFQRLFPKIADAIVPGITFEALTRVGLERGQYREAEGRAEEWLRQRMAAHCNPAEPYELELDDGRWLRVVERRTPDSGTVGLRIDITELKRHQIMLAEKTALLEAALDSSLDAVIVADERGRVITANAQVTSVFGYAPEEMVGRDLVDLIVPERLRQRHLAAVSPK